jgi:hypothetical protein
MLLLKDANASVSLLIIEIVTVHYKKFHDEALVKEFVPLLLKVMSKCVMTVDNWMLTNFDSIVQLLLHLKVDMELGGKVLKDFLMVILGKKVASY